MNWTNELPAKQGYYWWRKNKFKTVIIRSVWNPHDPNTEVWDTWYCRHCCETLCDKEKVSDVGGEWYGPIIPPE